MVITESVEERSGLTRGLGMFPRKTTGVVTVVLDTVTKSTRQVTVSDTIWCPWVSSYSG